MGRTLRIAALALLAGIVTFPAGQAATGVALPAIDARPATLENERLACTWNGMKDLVSPHVALVETVDGYAVEAQFADVDLGVECRGRDHEYIHHTSVPAWAETLPLDQVVRSVPGVGVVLAAERHYSDLRADHNPNPVDQGYELLFAQDGFDEGGKPSPPAYALKFKVACSFGVGQVAAGTGSEAEDGLYQGLEGFGGGPIIPLGCAVTGAGAAIICVDLNLLKPGVTCAFAAASSAGAVGLMMGGLASGEIFAGDEKHNDNAAQTCGYVEGDVCDLGFVLEKHVGGYPNKLNCVEGKATATIVPVFMGLVILAPLAATADLTVPACDAAGDVQQD